MTLDEIRGRIQTLRAEQQKLWWEKNRLMGAFDRDLERRSDDVSRELDTLYARQTEHFVQKD